MRFLLLSTHYRSPIEYSDGPARRRSRRGLEGFYRFFERFERVAGEQLLRMIGEIRRGRAPRPSDGGVPRARGRRDSATRFRELMDDDFNTGGAVGVLFELVTALNRFADAAKLEDRQGRRPTAVADFRRRRARAAQELGQILGLFFEPPQGRRSAATTSSSAGLMQLLIDLRNNLRAEAKKIAARTTRRRRCSSTRPT